MTTLYELTGAYRQLLEEDEEGFGEALSQLEGSLEEKAENVAFAIRNLEMEEQAMRSEAAHFAERAKVAGNKTARLKEYLLSHLESIPMEQIKGRLFTISVQNSPPSVYILNMDALPAECKVLLPATWRPVAANIVRAWKEKGKVPGAEITVGRHIRIW